MLAVAKNFAKLQERDTQSEKITAGLTWTHQLAMAVTESQLYLCTTPMLAVAENFAQLLARRPLGPALPELPHLVSEARKR